MSMEVPVHKVIMVGIGGVGKSALTLKFLYDEFNEDYTPTKVDTYKQKVDLDGKKCELDILDTAGMEDYAAIRDNYFRTGEGFLLVFSLTDTDSFEELNEFRDQILRVKYPNGPGMNATPIPMVLVANKCDLTTNIQVSDDAAKQTASSWEIPYFRTSAKTCENVNEAFHELVRVIDRSKQDNNRNNPSKSNNHVMADNMDERGDAKLPKKKHEKDSKSKKRNKCRIL
ncbi:hypothetical protein SNEBB_007245 [Seison nebaliae]|nr:hypothetical protein SNEBB_007245 [Seison nebaliae]